MTIQYSEPGHFAYPQDSDPNDPPADFERLSDRLAALQSGLTTTQRNGLSGTDLWAGRRIWNTTTQRTEEYTGTLWRAVGSADLTAHTGTADPHTGYVQKDTATTKGDLFVATAAGVISRRSVGADTSVLQAASGESTGMRWRSIDDVMADAGRRTIRYQTDIAVEATASSFSTGITIADARTADSWPVAVAGGGSVLVAAGAGVVTVTKTAGYATQRYDNSNGLAFVRSATAAGAWTTWRQTTNE